MAEAYIGEIRLFGGMFVPLGFQACDGTLLSIGDYSSLYNLIGTTYGGDGSSTFAVPNLNGRVSVGAGIAVSGSNYPLGAASGAEDVTLVTNTMPSHNHPLQAAGAAGDTSTPRNSVFLSQEGPSNTTNPVYAAYDANNEQIALTGVGNAGGSQPHNNIQPSLALRYIIATQGTYPSQN